VTPEAPAPNREIAPSQVTLKTVFTVSFGVLVVLALVMAAIHSLVAITLTSTAVLVAVALDHGVQWLVRRRFPRTVAVGVVALGMLGLLTGLGFTLIPPAVDQGKAMVQQAPAFIRTARQSKAFRRLDQQFHIADRIEKAEKGLPEMLEGAATPNGLKLTETGNLARSVVGEFARTMDWPAFDIDVVFSVCKVVNEPDIFPLHFIRRLAKLAKLVRRERGRLKASVLGREMRTEAKRRSLQALLFQLTCWHVNLGFFDAFLPPQSWPQDDIGVLLWSLSVAAAGWQTPEKLTRLCAIPVESVISAERDPATHVVEARVLQPLVWFGLLDQKPAKPDHTRFYERQLYRKSPLFDRFLTFNVQTEHAAVVRH